MEGGEELSIEELTSNISTYKEQLQQVKLLLEDDPGNSEYKDMEKELEELINGIRDLVSLSDSHEESLVIALTEELLETTKQNENFVSAISTNASTSDTLRESNRISQYEMDSINMLDREDRFPVGTKIQAVWSEDGEWYNATVEACTLNGYFVRFDEWGNKEEVDPANVRLLQGDDDDAGVDALLKAEKEAEATKQALKRKIAQAAAGDFQSRSLPAKLRINPDDPEDVKAAKRKKIHSFKSKARFEQLEVTQNKRQNAWQQFQSTKGRAKKVGFFSGRKKESIFKSPEDPQGKVGVTGSGKGLTDFQKREKHLHLKGANIDNENGEADD